MKPCDSYFVLSLKKRLLSLFITRQLKRNTGLKTITHIAKISVNTHNSVVTLKHKHSLVIFTPVLAIGVVTLKHKTRFGNIYTSSCYRCFSNKTDLKGRRNFQPPWETCLCLPR